MGKALRGKNSNAFNIAVELKLNMTKSGRLEVT